MWMMQPSGMHLYMNHIVKRRICGIKICYGSQLNQGPTNMHDLLASHAQMLVTSLPFSLDSVKFMSISFQ